MKSQSPAGWVYTELEESAQAIECISNMKLMALYTQDKKLVGKQYLAPTRGALLQALLISGIKDSETF